VSLLVVGSVAFDSVETPFGMASDVLGGSAVYFSYAASFFAPVRLVGVVGQDFPAQHIEQLQAHGIDTSGLVTRPGATFRWKGRYQGAMDSAETLAVELNVFGEFEPDIPERFRATPYVFLANGSPRLQRHVLGQMHQPKVSFCDTMNLWIATERDELVRLLSEVDGLVINEGEAVQLTGCTNLVAAGKQIARLGPSIVVVKKGSHGALLFADGTCCPLPAFPTDEVTDPTGAGDSFAGGMMGYLAEVDDVSLASIKRALVYGTVMASFNIEDFSLRRFERLERADIDHRAQQLLELTRF